MYAPTCLTTMETAQLLGVAVRDLVGLRRTGQGPRWIKLGRGSVRYLRASVEAWALERGHETHPVAVPDPRLPEGLDASTLPPSCSDRQAQGVVRVSDSEWRARRRRGDSPAWTRDAQVVSWRTADLVAWLEAQECQTAMPREAQAAT